MKGNRDKENEIKGYAISTAWVEERHTYFLTVEVSYQ